MLRKSNIALLVFIAGWIFSGCAHWSYLQNKRSVIYSLDRAERLYTSGSYSEAIKEYKLALTYDVSRKQKALIYLNIGNIYRKNKSYTEAIASYQESLKLRSKWAHAHFILGATLFESDILESAARELDIAIDTGEATFDVYYIRGRVYQSMGLYSKAVEKYLDALRLDATVADAHYFLGITYQNQNRLPEAEDSLEDAVTLDDTNILYINELGYNYFLRGAIIEAWQTLNRSLSINPDIVQTHVYLGFVYYKQQKWDNAIDEFTFVIGKRPKEALAYFLRGYCYLNKEMAEEFRDDIRKAREFDLNGSVSDFAQKALDTGTFKVFEQEK